MLSLLGATIAVMVLFPETPTAKFLSRVLIEEPARKLSELTWSKVVFGLVVCLAFVVFAYATVPLDLALFAAGDTAAYLEILTALWLVAANLRLRATLGRIGSVARRAAQWALAGCSIVRAHVSARTRSRSSRKRLASTRDRDDGSAEPNLVFA
ncbi:MAG: hypothetical protein WDN69_19840 [Aliidongia sp.]